MTVRAAVVGTSFGARIHVPALRQAGFEVVAVVGTDPEKTARRAQRLGVDHGCTSLAQALDLGLDAVSLASPPATHAPLALQALAAGCHVLCEKPFTLDVAQALELVESAAGSGLVGLVGHEFRWSPAQSITQWALEKGLIGAPRLVLSLSFLQMLREVTMPAWWFEPALGGGWLGASGSHRIDNMLQWFGAVEAVSATLPIMSDPPLDVDDSFAVRCRLPGEVEAHLLQSAAAVGPAYAGSRVVGTSGTLWTEGTSVHLATAAEPAGQVLNLPVGSELPDVADLATGPLAGMTRTELPPYIRLAQAFRAAIEGAPPPPGPRPASFADGLAAMRVIEAVRTSAAAGGAWTEVGS